MNSLPLHAPETPSDPHAAPPPRAAGPASFTLLPSPADTGTDARYDESLLAPALTQGGALASIWQTRRSLVVPRSYRRFEAFESACERFALQGWPVTVRQTGGGIVPQGPGIINLSLAYRVHGPPMQHSEPAYRLICRLLADALRVMGIEAFPAPVEGSFCDGRYNLAVRRRSEVVKLAGTAQSWRRIPGSRDEYMGLVHALVLLDTDTLAVTERANTFEASLGSERRYQADKVVSVAELLGTSQGLRADFEAALKQALCAFHYNAIHIE